MVARSWQCDLGCDLGDAGVRRDQCDLGLGQWCDLGWWRNLTDAWCDKTDASSAISLLFLSLSLSLSSIFLGCNSFESKIKPKMVLHLSSLIL